MMMMMMMMMMVMMVMMMMMMRRRRRRRMGRSSYTPRGGQLEDINFLLPSLSRGLL